MEKTRKNGGGQVRPPRFPPFGPGRTGAGRGIGGSKPGTLGGGCCRGRYFAITRFVSFSKSCITGISVTSSGMVYPTPLNPVHKYVLIYFQAAYASYLTSPSGYGLLGPSAAAAAITSLANTPVTPLPALATPTSTTPPSSLGLVSPRLTPKESSESNGDPNGGCLSMPPLPPLVNSTLSDDEDLKKSGLFPSFLPIRQLRLRAQEHLEAASNANSINKENGFDSSSSPTAPPAGTGAAGAPAPTQS